MKTILNVMLLSFWLLQTKCAKYFKSGGRKCDENVEWHDEKQTIVIV